MIKHYQLLLASFLLAGVCTKRGLEIACPEGERGKFLTSAVKCLPLEKPGLSCSPVAQ